MRKWNVKRPALSGASYNTYAKNKEATPRGLQLNGRLRILESRQGRAFLEREQLRRRWLEEGVLGCGSELL